MRRWPLLLLLLANPVAAVPVVPNFRSGTTSSHTESTTQITEVIRSVDFATGYTYSASGSGIKHSGTSIAPGAEATQSQTVSGVNSTWTGLQLEDKPEWSLITPGASFQFVESYSGPGIQTVTDITRTTVVESTTDTTSIFAQ